MAIITIRPQRHWMGDGRKIVVPAAVVAPIRGVTT